MLTEETIKTEKQMKAFAQKNGLIILFFTREYCSKELIGVAVKENKRYDGVPLYEFGKIYSLGCNQFSYHQQGCYTTTDEMEVRKEAYKFFGLK